MSASASRSGGRSGRSGGCPRGVSRAGNIAEVFASIQGEGIFVGVLQVFVRTAGCSRRCVYCDTPAARTVTARCALRGDGETRYAENPVDAAEIVSFTRSRIAANPGVHSVSVTGGEPLEQADFLTELLPRLRSIGLPIYLETNGLEEPACGAVARYIDIVSLDIKLPSLCGGGDHFATYRRVLPLFDSADIFTKVVVTGDEERDEFTEAVGIVAAFDRSMPFVIQPARREDAADRIGARELLRYYVTAAARLDNVRVIPQCHRILGIP
jgi:7-carboxy-7-deazaguanine synthase